MANITTVTKNTGDQYTAAEQNQQKDWTNEPAEKLTVFTDTNIIVDGTKSYSTVKAITASTHTITASDVDGNAGTALSAEHKQNNYLSTRYSFSQDCTLTLVGFDTVGNQTGTIEPIPLGTYDFYLIAGTFGVNLLIKNSGVTATPSFPLTLSNFSIEDANKDRVYFDTNQAPSGTTYAGFTLADPTKTIIGVTFNTGFTTGHYFTVSVAYVIGDTAPTIAYDGTDDWTGTGGALALFTAAAITNNIGLTQLSAVTLGTVTPAAGQVTIAVTNPNSSNEDQNQLYYKLNTEPTVWTAGVVMATGGTSVIQTGLTDGLLYNFYMVAEGDGVTFGDSPNSNTVNGTPGVAQVVLLEDTFTGSTIDVTTRWNLTNPDTPQVAVSQNNILIWNWINGATIGAFDNYLESQNAFTNPFLELAFHIDYNTSNASPGKLAGLWLDSANHVLFQNAAGDINLRITAGATLELFDTIGVDASSAQRRLKIRIDGNTITAHNFNGAAWVDVTPAGGPYSFDIGANKKVMLACGRSATANVNYEIDNLRLSNYQIDTI